MITRRKLCWSCHSPNYRRVWNGGRPPRLYRCADCGAESRPFDDYVAARADALLRGDDPMAQPEVRAKQIASRVRNYLMRLPKADRFRVVYLRVMARRRERLLAESTAADMFSPFPPLETEGFAR